MSLIQIGSVHVPIVKIKRWVYIHYKLADKLLGASIFRYRTARDCLTHLRDFIDEF